MLCLINWTQPTLSRRQGQRAVIFASPAKTNIGHRLKTSAASAHGFEWNLSVVPNLRPALAFVDGDISISTRALLSRECWPSAAKATGGRARGKPLLCEFRVTG
ncbi:unnamed protein product [Ixodes persulcatus]